MSGDGYAIAGEEGEALLQVGQLHLPPYHLTTLPPYYSLLTTKCLPLIAHHLLLGNAYRLPLTTYRLLLTAYRLQLTYHLPLTTYHLVLATYCI